MTAASQLRRFTGDFRADVLVAVVIALAFLAAGLYQRSLAGQTTAFRDSHSGFTLNIPDHWTVNTDTATDTFLSAYNSRADSIYKSTVTGQSFALDPDSPVTPDELVDRLVQRHQIDWLGYHLLDIQKTTVAGADARLIQYAYVTRPIDDPFSSSPPVIVIATDTLIFTRTQYWLLTTAADEKIADQAQIEFDAILASVRLP